MIYQVSSKQDINYNPQSEVEDILRCVHMILRVYQSEQPLMRGFSIDSTLIDKRIDIIENQILQDLVTKLKKYEPRASLQKVSVQQEKMGDFTIFLYVELMI
ncbi:MAG TPA: hypothetical protein VIG61_03815 [Fusobacterium sp.]|uniref:hypothetical protein n=1 Tax=Fusobacterium sp. TaxID=68766 RepID=UPI002F42CB5F